MDDPCYSKYRGSGFAPERTGLHPEARLAASIRAARLRLRVAEIPGDEPKRIGGVRKLSVIRNGLGGLAQILYDFFFFRPKRG